MDARPQLLAKAQSLLQELSESPDRFDNVARLRSLDSARALYREAGDGQGEASVLERLASVASNMDDHVAALDYLREAREIAAGLDDAELQSDVASRLWGVHMAMGDHEFALQLTQEEYERLAGSVDVKRRMFAANGLGCVLVEMGRAAEGIAHLRDAHAFVDRIEPPSFREHVRSQSLADIAQALLALDRPDEALATALDGAAVARAMPHEPLIGQNLLYAGRAAVKLHRPESAVEYLGEAREIATRLNINAMHRQVLFELAAAQAALGSHADAYLTHMTAHEMEKATRREEAFRRAEFLRAKSEIDRARLERESADRLLFSVLPAGIATRMRNGESPIADDLADVSVLFADLVGFTALSSRVSPRELLGMLERVFGEFDALAVSLHLEKIKTIGDAYLVVGGALDSKPDHLVRCARMGFRMIDAVARIAAETRLPLSLRVGLHAGPAIAGVIGSERRSYDLWGETVNLASRLESSGEPGRVHVLAGVAHRLATSFDSLPRGTVTLKGIGEVSTALLLERASA
jgi:class 3 adenylate cyclase